MRRSSGDNAVMLFFAKSNPTTQVITEIKTGEQYGMAVAKDNPGLLAVVNETLKAAKADGTYAAAYQKYFSGELADDAYDEKELAMALSGLPSVPEPA